ncbi:MAG: pyruvate kinase [Spirochaetaceae bacterium]|nr:MAG: pyruvate kinase [Spirochaetaceae bacterium]
MSKRTKIICTIAPASASTEMLQAFAEAGMDVARINFSHGDRDTNGSLIQAIKTLRAQTGRNIGILQDLGGPKIRVGELPREGIFLPEGDSLLLASGPRVYMEGKPIPVNYPALVEDVPEGARILLDDGLLELKVERNDGEFLRCRIIHGGRLYSHKGVNFPDLILSRGAPTDKDLDDLRFGLERGVDFVAVSFVQTAGDLEAVREAVGDSETAPCIIAKLERVSALQNLDSIIAVSDGIMVARGDLGIEADISMIPVYQKTTIRKANLVGIPVITATQMLDSMIRNPLPTRAEVTDVANAIYDGSDAIMLSGETAVGAYPVESVRMMRRIADHVEENLGLDRGWVRSEMQESRYSTQLAVAQSVCQTAERLGAHCIVAQTISGTTARLIAMYRPRTPVIALTPRESTFHQLSLVWGIEALLVQKFEKDFLKTTATGDEILTDRGYVKKGDLVVISAGIPSAKSGGTNIMKLHKVGLD